MGLAIGIFLGFLTFEAIKDLKLFLEKKEQKKRDKEFQLFRAKMQEFEDKHQQSPNASIIEQGIFVAKSKQELDEMFDGK